MTPRRSSAAVAAAAALALLAAGCGKDSPGSKTTTVSVASSAASVATPDVAPGTRTEAVTGATNFDPEKIYKQEGPGVVTVISAGYKGQAAGAGGLGSGFVIDTDGEIATNAHVVTTGEGAKINEAHKVYVSFSDGNQVSAKVVGYDPFADVALLKVNPAGLHLRALPLGSTKGLKVGAPVAAIGSPFGEEQSLSVGVISATGRSIDSLTGFSTSGAIQTDAAINHGNSGGPLLDAGGHVLGINSQIRTESGDGTGVGFAVPVDQVKHSLDQLRAGGKVKYAYLGVSTRALYPQVAEHFKLPVKKGVWVQAVPPGGPAAQAGIRKGDHSVDFQELPWLVGGDIIVGVNNTKVVSDDDLAQSLLPYKPGDSVDLHIYRDGKAQTVSVTLGERPLSAPPAG